MQTNLDRTRGLIFSQAVLLALVETGLPRQEAYRMGQRNALPVWGEGLDFLELLLADAPVVERLGEDGVRGCFDLAVHQSHVDEIFRRVFDD